jgi:AbrB family looped-hinge helix DNA binding protein
MSKAQTTQITKDWMITIPKRLRSHMGFKIGARLEMEDIEGGIIVRTPVPVRQKVKRIEEYIGYLQTDKLFDPEAEREAAIQVAVERATGHD